MPSSAAIETGGLTKAYRGFLPWRKRTVLHGLDLSVAPGEAVGVFGPNGTGKSTTLRILAGIEGPTTGQARILGGNPLHPSVRQRLGYMPESSPFPPHRSGQEILWYLGSLRGKTRKESRKLAAESLERVGLGAAARQRTGKYSFGMQRRLALAQAIFHQPMALLLDEPLAGLDVEGITLTCRIVKECKNRGAAVLVASHQLPNEDILDRIAFLKDGTFERMEPLNQE